MIAGHSHGVSLSLNETRLTLARRCRGTARRLARSHTRSRISASVPGLRGDCAWALSNDLPNQITNFGGEQAAWGPQLVTNYSFDTRIHNFASTPAANPCG